MKTTNNPVRVILSKLALELKVVFWKMKYVSEDLVG